MKKRMGWAVLILACSTLLAACAAPYVFDVNGLKKKVLTYYTNLMSTFGYGSTQYGHDKLTLTFDSTGLAGTFDQQAYSFDFADQAAVTAGNYSNKTWFQYAGARGQFTYDPKTFAFTATLAKVYSPNAAAIPMSNGDISASDYSYNDPATIVSVSASSGSAIWEGPMLITQNNIHSIFLAGSTPDMWKWTGKETIKWSMAGVSNAEITETTRSIIVTSDSITRDNLFVTTDTIGLASPVTYTTEYKYGCPILTTFLAGEATGDKKFDAIWVKGKTAVFQCQQTEYVEIGYTGNAVLIAPTVNPTTGIGLTGIRYVRPWYYKNNQVSTGSYTLTHGGTYCYFGAADQSSSRSLTE
jgi:hypothetical protein